MVSRQQRKQCILHSWQPEQNPALSAPSALPPPPPAGLQLDPSNAQMKQGLEDAKEQQAAGRGGPAGGGGGGLFANPEVLGRLATNPQTRALLAQPDFMAMLQDINTNPNNIQARAGERMRATPGPP